MSLSEEITPRAEQHTQKQLCLAHARGLKQATAKIEFKSTLPCTLPALDPGAGGVTSKVNRSTQTFHRLLREEKFAIEKFGRGSMSHLLAIANVEELKFSQLSTKEKRAWVKANSDNRIRSFSNWSSTTLGKKARMILTSQVRAFGAMGEGPFASMLARDYAKEKMIIEWKKEAACHSDSMLPPDAPPEPPVDGQASPPFEPNPPAGETRALLNQEHHHLLSGDSKNTPIRILPEHIKKQEEKVYVLGATQPQSGAYRTAVGQLELMWFVSLEATERQIWMNKYSTPAISQLAEWAGKSEIERARRIIMSRVRDIESKTGIPQVVPDRGKGACRLFSIGKEDGAATA